MGGKPNKKKTEYNISQGHKYTAHKPKPKATICKINPNKATKKKAPKL